MKSKMQYSYREMESCGTHFFRVLQRKNDSDSWTMAAGSYDCDTKADAEWQISEFQRKQSIPIETWFKDRSMTKGQNL